MPRLPVPEIQKRINVKPPVPIPSPEGLAKQAYGGIGQLGIALAQIGNAFATEIINANINKEITETWETVDKEHYKYFQSLDKNEDSSTYSPGFQTKLAEWETLIKQQKTRGAREVLKRRLANNAWGWHDQVIRKGRERLRLNAIDSYGKILVDESNKYAIPQWDSENKRIEILLESLKRTISDAETNIETAGQKDMNGLIRPNQVRQADLEKVKMSIIANTVYKSFPDKVKGHEWLKENYKELGLSIEKRNSINDSLDEAWEDDEAILKFEIEKQKQTLVSQMAKDIEINNYQLIAQQISASGLSNTDKEFLMGSLAIGRERRNNALIVGKDLPANSFVYQTLLDLIPDVQTGDITLEKAQMEVDLAYIAGDLGTGNSSQIKYREIRNAFRTKEIAGKSIIIKEIINLAKNQIITTGTDEKAAERMMAMLLNAGMTKEQVIDKRKKEWAKFQMVQRAIRESSEIKDAPVNEVEDIGLKILEPYLDKSYEKEIEGEIFENWKMLYGVNEDDIVKGDYDYWSAAKDGAYPIMWSNLSVEQQKKYVNKTGKYPHSATFIWPDEYKISGETKQTQSKDPATIMLSPEEQLEILRMSGGPLVNKQIDFYLNAGMSVKQTVDALKYVQGTQTQSQIEIGTVRRNRKTGERQRWDGQQWQKIK